MPTILVIDDEEVFRDWIVTALGTAGYEVLDGENGARGLELARRHKPDLIFCDLMMPGLSGYETLAALRDDPSTANIPVVFLSGFNDPLVKERGSELGMDGYLEKPVTLEELLKVIEATLTRRGHRETT